MSGFVFPPPATSPAPPDQGVIAGDGWWPSVDVAKVRAAVRLDTTITTDKIEDAIRQAMLDLAQDLADWRSELEAAGVPSMDEAPGQTVVGGEKGLPLRWFRAVYSTVAADLGERLISQGLTSAGAERVEELRAEIEEHRRNARFAIRDILAKPRIAAELV